MSASSRIAAVAAAALLCACGGPSIFSIGARDSDAAEVQRVVERRSAPASPAPPVAVLALKGERSEIALFDLEARKTRWRVPGQVSSRFAIGDSTVAHAAGDSMVARDVVTGAVLWQQPLEGVLVGLSSGSGILAWVTQSSQAGGQHWITAVDERSGKTLWSRNTTSTLGAPEVSGGQVLVPLLRQWLVILDAQTGARLGRLRGVEHEVAFVRTDGRDVTFGSNAGVYELDSRAAEASSKTSTFARAELPEAFARSQYGFNAYDPVQSAFTAYDRNNRLLWRLDGGKFRNSLVLVHSYRYVFGLEADTGRLRWAYSHPRFDLMASEHVGEVVALASSTGQLAALDPDTGKLRYLEELGGARGGTRVQVVGASFRAEGWTPTDEVPQIVSPNTTGALTAIARDRDSRFAHIKQYALRSLAERGDDQALDDLIGVVTRAQARPEIYKAAVEALVERRDPASLRRVLDGLERHYDFLRGVEPRAVGVLADVIVNIDVSAMDAQQRRRAIGILTAHVESPATPGPELTNVIRALAHVSAGEGMPAVRRFVLLHRADQRAVGEGRALERALHALSTGSAPDRAVVHFVALDRRSHRQLAKMARDILSSASR